MTDACTVSGVLYDAGGELLTETQLVFTRLGKLAALEAETAVAPVFGTGARKTVTTNATTAAFSIDLMPGSWSVTYQGVTAQETISFEVPVAASANFAVIIDQTNAEGSAIVESYAAHMASTSNPHSVTKAQVGLGDVDNTSDANKPVSTAQAEADALRLAKAQNLADLENAATARVNLGLGDVDNTSDADKPVSTAQAEADALRLAKAQNLADLENAATARVNLGLGDVDNTSDADKPVSTAQAATFEAEALVGARQSGAGKLAPAMIKFPAARRDTYASGGGSRYQWVAAWEMGADDRIERITGYLSSEGGANTTAEMQLYRQVTASSAQITSLLTGYELIETVQVPFTGGGFEEITFALERSILAKAGERYAVAFGLRDVGGDLVPLGCGYSVHYPSQETAYVKGGFAPENRLDLIQTIGTNAKVFCRVESRAAQPAAHSIPATGRARGSMWGSGGGSGAFTQVTFCEVPSNDLQLSAIGFDIQDVSTNTAFLRLRLVLRPYDAGDYPTSWIAGQQAVDQHVCVVEVPIADVYQLTFPDKRQRVKINLDRVVPVPRGMMVLAEVTALQANRTSYGTFDVEAVAVTPRRYQIERGGYTFSNPPTVQSYHGSSGFGMVLYSATQPAPLSLMDEARFLSPLPRRQASRTLTLPDLSVSALDGDQVLASQALTFDAVGATSVVGTTLNLRYLERNPLPARWWSAITVTRDSDSAVLTAGVDYEVNQPQGWIRGLVNTAEFSVTVSITAYPARVDMVTFTPWERAYQVWKGTERILDPDLWGPDEKTIGSNGRVEVARVLVTYNQIEILDRTLAERQSVRPRRHVAGLDELRRHNAEVMAPVIGALQTGQPLTIIGDGDSITAAHGGTAEADQLVPGGTTRDRADSYTIQTPADAWDKAGAPLIDGPAGPNMHVEASYHHRYRKALEARFGASITWKNLGIGGTDASAGGTGVPEDRYDGSNPNRLQAIVDAKGASGVTLCTIAFATNEEDLPSLVNYIATIAGHCITNGIVPLVIGQPKVWPINEERQRVHDMYVMRGALARGAAFVPLALPALNLPDCLGLFPSLFAGAGGVNHPGLYEHILYGRWIYDMAFRGS